MDDLAGRLSRAESSSPPTASTSTRWPWSWRSGNGRVDYPMLDTDKIYGKSPDADRRYSPPVCLGTLGSVGRHGQTRTWTWSPRRTSSALT